MLDGNLLIIFLALIFKSCSSKCFPIYPEQIHLSIGNSPREMVVTWVTFSDTKASFVWYGKMKEGLTQRAEGCAKKFSVGRTSRRVRFVHKTVIPNLQPLSYYVYRCGSWYGASQPQIFKTNAMNTEWSPRLVIFGDMGWKGAVTFPYIFDEAKDYDVDAIVHVGDIAYDLSSKDGYVGDQFMKMIQPLATIVPYMTTVGNHEQYQNFSHYKNIFSMPGKNSGLFYSFNLGPAHFVAVSTEVYYFTEYGIEPIKRQYEWLERDLRVSSRVNIVSSKGNICGCHHKDTIISRAVRNRHIRPWIVVFGHRPFYCSSDEGEDCSLDKSLLRDCILSGCNYGLEDLLHKYKVDLIFSGHMHYYERSWPIYKQRVYNGSCLQPYKNPGAAIHIITGAAGMKSGTESASYVRRDLFGFFSSEYSFTILKIYNRSFAYMEQVSATRNGQIIDAVYFIKDP